MFYRFACFLYRLECLTANNKSADEQDVEDQALQQFTDANDVNAQRPPWPSQPYAQADDRWNGSNREKGRR